MDKTVRVAAVQAEPAWFDPRRRRRQGRRPIGQAQPGRAARRLGETFVPGYPWWIWPDLHRPRVCSARYAANSMTRDGAEMDRIWWAAAQHRIHVVLGFQRTGRGQLLHGTGVHLRHRRAHRGAPQAQAHPRRTLGLRRR
ncbi:hypothetical protein HBB16_00215 [Pseudonocardia sp. MCCB 268]|nr:hypothetical protein [Pseudonocardia cytotoxica]